jgi:23S rRNA (uracil1939-C5)-methyltransferase
LDKDLIIRVAAKGDGTTADGRHVAGAAPGDRLNPEGGLIRGPHYQMPPCRHFNECGGCSLQHIDETALAEFVLQRCLNALKGQDINPANVHPVHLSPPHTRRRVALRAVRMGKKVQLGFSTSGSHRVIDLSECPVMHPTLAALLPALRKFAAQFLGHRGQWQIKLALIDQGIDMLLEGYQPEGLVAHEGLTEFAQANGLARLAVDTGYGAESLWEPEPATVTLAGLPVAYPHFSFLQATADGEAALLSAVQTAVGEAKTLADLFAGLGTFALGLRNGRRVYAAEAERAAIMALKSSSDRAVTGIATDHRDLFRRPLTPDELNRFEAVVLDPPRAGAKEQIAQLALSKVPVIAYVSCNPASFARDAGRLVAAGYVLTDLWPVGQFRWSTHVELVARFVRP